MSMAENSAYNKAEHATSACPLRYKYKVVSFEF